jgi:hypothetical protein
VGLWSPPAWPARHKIIRIPSRPAAKREIYSYSGARSSFNGHFKMLRNENFVGVASSLCLALLASAADLSTTPVRLPVVNLGLTNFQDGLAAPGWMFEELPETYVAGQMKDPNGKTVPGANSTSVYSTTTHIAFISKKRVLGGWLLGEAVLSLADVEVQFAGGAPIMAHGFGDLYAGAGLQWKPRKVGKSGVFAQRFVADFSVPTGTYSDLRPVNIGNHFVYANPNYTFTYQPNEKVEFSSRIHYLWNSTSHDPFVGLGFANMQAGQAVHANFTASYEVLKDVRLGLNGYWLQQFTDDKIDGEAISPSRERTVGLGPGMQLSGRGIWFRVNSYLETAVRNRPSGIALTLRITKVFGAGED